MPLSFENYNSVSWNTIFIGYAQACFMLIYVFCGRNINSMIEMAEESNNKEYARREKHGKHTTIYYIYILNLSKNPLKNESYKECETKYLK